MSPKLMKSKFVCRPSVVRVAIIPEPNAQISFQISFVASPELFAEAIFLFFFYFLRIFFVFVNMRPHGSENSKRYCCKSQPKAFKLFLCVFVKHNQLKFITVYFHFIQTKLSQPLWTQHCLVCAIPPEQ